MPSDVHRVDRAVARLLPKLRWCMGHARVQLHRRREGVALHAVHCHEPDDQNAKRTVHPKRSRPAVLGLASERLARAVQREYSLIISHRARRTRALLIGAARATRARRVRVHKILDTGTSDWSAVNRTGARKSPEQSSGLLASSLYPKSNGDYNIYNRAHHS
eukprot:COSAG02_NODE_4554_length_5220_cov_31.069713_5_plen_162_part_00